MRSIKIKSSIKDYEVFFIKNLNNLTDELVKKYRCHFLIDKNIWDLYRDNLKSGVLKAESVNYFEAVEKNKTLDGVNKYVYFLLDNGIQKQDKVVVIGGGLVQDIGSFTSHIIKRGIDWVFVPTTLLSMVDSCIGAKSGINIGGFKNQVGSFHPPIEIYINISFLDTLSEIDLINGIGEIVKHALIKGGVFFPNLEKNSKVTEDVVYKSLLIKKEIVEKDELEKNIRKLLNYGHTFGHALEGYTKNKIPHGLGVLMGMDLANFISMKRGILLKEEFLRIHNFIKKFISVERFPIDDVDLYIKFLKTDKKVVGDEVDAILCKGIGKISVVRLKFDGKLKRDIKDYLIYFNKEK